MLCCLLSLSGVLCCQLQSTSEGDPKPSAPAQPKPVQTYTTPPVHTSPQVPNLHMSGAINPTLEQVACFPENTIATLVCASNILTDALSLAVNPEDL